MEQNIFREKDNLDKILKKSKNKIDLIEELRKRCDTINFENKDILVIIEGTTFRLDTKVKKVKQITFFNKQLKKIQEFLF